MAIRTRVAHLTGWLHLGGAVVIAAALFMASVQSGLAMRPCPGDPWFSRIVTLDVPPLPTGVTIRLERGDDDCYADRSPRMEIRNNSPRPLYLLALLPPDGDQADRRLPRIRANHSPIAERPELAAFYAIGTDVVSPGPFFVGPCGGPCTRTQLIPDGYSMSMTPFAEANVVGLTQDVLTGLSTRIPLADGRPADAEVPAPEDGTLRLAYDTQLIEIPITTRFTLNESYDPEASRKHERAKGLWLIALSVGFLAVCGAAIVLFVLSLRWVGSYLLRRGAEKVAPPET
jgi:hypothetical protein